MGKDRIVVADFLKLRNSIMSETFLRQIILEELEYEPSLDAAQWSVRFGQAIQWRRHYCETD